MGSVGTFNVPDHNSAVVLRSTDPLPAEYRIEVTLRAIDFGGQRNGTWDYDGKTNGTGLTVVRLSTRGPVRRMPTTGQRSVTGSM